MRLTTLFVFLAATSSLYPQTCGPSGATLRTLDELQTPDDMRLSAAERTARKIEVLRKALNATPNDVFLHEEYQRTRIGGMEADRPPVMEEYEKLLARHPGDPVYLYLAALAQTGSNTAQAISRLERAIERSPAFGLPHLLLAQIYSASSHAGPAKVQQHLERFESACPESVRAIPALPWSKDAALVAHVAARIRHNLKDRTDIEALAAYPILWSLEAAQRKSDEQAENLARLKQDVARLLVPEVPRNAAWLSTLQSASSLQDGVDEYARDARREIAARYPNSGAGISAAFGKAIGSNPYPRNGTPEQIAAFWRKQWQAALPLARQFPGSLSIATDAACSIVQDPAATPAEIHGAIALFLAATKADPDGMRTLPPQPIEIALTLAGRGIVDDVPDLVFAGFAAVERDFSPGRASDVSGPSAASLRQRRDLFNFWGYNALSEAYVRLGRLSSAKDLLIQQDDILNRLRPADSAPSGDKVRFAEDEAVFWYLKGLLAEAEHRKPDALVDYRNSIATFPPRRPSPDRRDQVMQAVQRLWKELGGTAQGWNDWAAHSSLRDFDAGSGATNAWTKLPADLTFTNVLGRQYKPKDLATKTTLITLWASWCGPCRAELPYFEKLYRQFQGRDDIVLLAFNIDDDIASMNNALAELKLSIPSVYAAPFVYSMLAQMAIPANWLLTPGKTEMLAVEAPTLPEWQAKTAQALEEAAAR
jgi:thiol-disulfide isomerase/thioredoxin